MGNTNAALAQNATQLARSTPTEGPDLSVLVREVACTKANVGISLRGKHGEQSLFSGVCKLYKAMLGMSKLEDRLSDEQVKQVKASIAGFWQKEFVKVFEYGDVQSITYDKPSARINGGEVKDVNLNARIHVARSLPDGQERKLYTLILRNQAANRLGKMKDNPGKYDRKDLASQEVKITALEKELERLSVLLNTEKEKQGN